MISATAITAGRKIIADRVVANPQPMSPIS